MGLWALFIVILVVAGLFVAVAGDPIAALILTVVWAAAIWALVVYGQPLIQAVWPAVLIVSALVVVSIGTLMMLASAAEERRFNDRGRSAPPQQ